MLPSFCCKPITAFSLLSILLFAVAFSLPIYASADDNEVEWKTHYAIGKFLNSEPAKPDQIFKIQHRVINGEIEEFKMYQEVSDVLVHNELTVNATSSDSGMIEVKFPRNFPYRNWPQDSTSSGVGFQVIDRAVGIAQSPELSDCFFNFSIPFTESIELLGPMPSILMKSPYRGDDVPDSCVPETITSRPMHQVMAGITPEDVLCPEEFHLVINSVEKPYCATPSTAEILKERWNIE